MKKKKKKKPIKHAGHEKYWTSFQNIKVVGGQLDSGLAYRAQPAMLSFFLAVFWFICR
jgi:hypothetical protein